MSDAFLASLAAVNPTKKVVIIDDDSSENDMETRHQPPPPKKIRLVESPIPESPSGQPKLPLLEICISDADAMECLVTNAAGRKFPFDYEDMEIRMYLTNGRGVVFASCQNEILAEIPMMALPMVSMVDRVRCFTFSIVRMWRIATLAREALTAENKGKDRTLVDKMGQWKLCIDQDTNVLSVIVLSRARATLQMGEIPVQELVDVTTVPVIEEAPYQAVLRPRDCNISTRCIHQLFEPLMPGERLYMEWTRAGFRVTCYAHDNAVFVENYWPNFTFSSFYRTEEQSAFFLTSSIRDLGQILDTMSRARGGAPHKMRMAYWPDRSHMEFSIEQREGGVVNVFRLPVLHEHEFGEDDKRPEGSLSFQLASVVVPRKEMLATLKTAKPAQVILRTGGDLGGSMEMLDQQTGTVLATYKNLGQYVPLDETIQDSFRVPVLIELLSKLTAADIQVGLAANCDCGQPLALQQLHRDGCYARTWFAPMTVDE